MNKVYCQNCKYNETESLYAEEYCSKAIDIGSKINPYTGQIIKHATEKNINFGFNITGECKYFEKGLIRELIDKFI